jgi:cell wall-associated NlpC family hydrolase
MNFKPQLQRIRHSTWLLAALLPLATWSGLANAASALPLWVPDSGVIGIKDAYLQPEFWIQRQPSADAVLMTQEAIAARNLRLLREDRSMHDLAALPDGLTATHVLAWINALAAAPTKSFWDELGNPISQASIDAIVDNRALNALPNIQATRFGMVVQRTKMRSFPTALRVFSTQGETDIDRFQESALFPGDAVVIAHTSTDRQWHFVVSDRYAAWVDAQSVAEGERATILAYATRSPFRIMTGAKPRTVFTREQPQHSEMQLDMGVRIPLAQHPANQPVNGQHPYTSWILDLPLRTAEGQLAFAPALLPRNEDSQADYLALTRANILRQAFKFLGERYGWGHAYNARDCSGFVSEIYRSMGVILPRNTSTQAVSPVFSRTSFKKTDTRAARNNAVANLDIGDLIYIPGHVMLYIGSIDGVPYVIHDTNGGNYLGEDSELHAMHLNGVSVTPLALHFNKKTDYIDSITHIVRVAYP